MGKALKCVGDVGSVCRCCCGRWRKIGGSNPPFGIIAHAEAWERLPNPIKAGILAMVNAMEQK
jgi:hypothetical protein